MEECSPEAILGKQADFTAVRTEGYLLVIKNAFKK